MFPFVSVFSTRPYSYIRCTSSLTGHVNLLFPCSHLLGSSSCWSASSQWSSRLCIWTGLPPQPHCCVHQGLPVQWLRERYIIMATAFTDILACRILYFSARLLITPLLSWQQLQIWKYHQLSKAMHAVQIAYWIYIVEEIRSFMEKLLAMG